MSAPNASRGYYKREIPKLRLSVERCTGAVPDDGGFHVVLEGRVLGSFRSESAAVARFREIAEEMGYRPDSTVDARRSAYKEDLDNHFYESELYWSQSHRHRPKGGPGR